MKKPEELLLKLGIDKYTERHLQIIRNFLENKETDAKKLLDELGEFDAVDLRITEKWIKE